MRSDPRRRWRRRSAAPLLLAVAALAGGCSGSTAADSAPDPEPTAEERLACERVQELVDAVVGGEALPAMSGLGQMEQALAESKNATLEDNGREFFATISGTVPDAGELTIEESAALGDRTLAAAQPRLQALLDECSQLGLPIENLPTGDEQP
jgi:hypothetical protein